MSCPPPADPAAPCAPGMGLCRAVLATGTGTGVKCPAVFLAVWGRGEVNQAACATEGFTRVQQRACDLSRLVGEKKISCFRNVLWSLAGSITLLFYSSLGRFLCLVRAALIVAAQRGGGSWAAGSSWCALDSARPESHLRGSHHLSSQHTCLFGCCLQRPWFGMRGGLLHLSPLRSCLWWPRAAAEAPARPAWVDSLPQAPVATSQAELISLQLVTCTSVSQVLLE